MASIKSSESLQPFTLPLDVHGFVVVSEELWGLRFNFQVGTMYVEQELYTKSGHDSKTLLMQRTRCVDSSSWTLGASVYRVIGMFNSQMQASMFFSHQ